MLYVSSFQRNEQNIPRLNLARVQPVDANQLLDVDARVRSLRLMFSRDFPQCVPGQNNDLLKLPLRTAGIGGGGKCRYHARTSKAQHQKKNGNLGEAVTKHRNM